MFFLRFAPTVARLAENSRKPPSFRQRRPECPERRPFGQAPLHTSLDGENDAAGFSEDSSKNSERDIQG
jgi:hypothetical protein